MFRERSAQEKGSSLSHSHQHEFGIVRCVRRNFTGWKETYFPAHQHGARSCAQVCVLPTRCSDCMRTRGAPDHTIYEQRDRLHSRAAGF